MIIYKIKTVYTVDIQLLEDIIIGWMKFPFRVNSSLNILYYYNYENKQI